MRADAVLQQKLASLLTAKNMGLTREIGVSNFPIDLMQQAVAAVGIEHIATNQIVNYRLICKIARWPPGQKSREYILFLI